MPQRTQRVTPKNEAKHQVMEKLEKPPINDFTFLINKKAERQCERVSMLARQLGYL
jgi:hypothetical protein